MRRIWLLDNGHGKDTPGKRSPVYDGVQLMEYEFTRDIVKRLAILLEWARIEHRVLVPEINDISLSERVRRANAWDGNAVYLSIHANAGGGHGYEAYTSPGQTRSDEIATVILDSFVNVFPEATPRLDISDGDPDKEEKFYVLVKTSMPAVLTESFLWTTKPTVRNIL